MAALKPFKSYRPVPEKASQVASKPYDVLNTEEARKLAGDNALSFLHVVKPEIDLPAGHDPYALAVYERGRDNFREMIRSGVFIQDEKPCLYLYRLVMDGISQTGLVGLGSVQDYFDGVIKIHELTRPDKEEDRKQHIRVGRTHPEPVFFAYPAVDEIDRLVAGVEARSPEYDFTAEDGIQHSLWVVSDEAEVAEFCRLFQSQVPATYVADGHHRTAAAAGVGRELREANPDAEGDQPYDFFLTVNFPDNQLRIIDYNRVIVDLNGMSDEEMLEKLANSFDISPQTGDPKPGQLHELSMYLSGKWYRLKAQSHTFDDSDPIRCLDVNILSEQVLEPLLGIHDLRRDKRIDFVGGIRGLGELERRVDSGEMRVAFALYPVSMQQLIDIADSGKIMPPKTTWFEPKLRSGLFVHVFE